MSATFPTWPSFCPAREHRSKIHFVDSAVREGQTNPATLERIAEWV
jgi:hypothetical protein